MLFSKPSLEVQELQQHRQQLILQLLF